MNERGSMVPWLGALFLIGFAVLGLALDVALLAATYREAAFAADVGAEAGAARIEAAAAYDGFTRPDRSSAIANAEAAALNARPRSGRRASARIDGTSVCITVTDRYEPRLASLFAVGSEGVTANACATPGRG